MRFILIGIFLIINIAALIGIVRIPSLSYSNPELFGPRITIFGIENSVETQLSLLRQRRATLYASRQLRYNPFKKPQKTKKHHKHRREKYSFILRCPKLSTKYNPQKLGVEWSQNSTTILRIISDGRKFGSMEFTDYEQWRGINQKLNVIAYGPKPEKRYKFEFEEARGWFSMKIRNLQEKDIGEWKCLIKLRFKNGTIFEYESRKKAVSENAFNKTKIDEIKYSDAPLFSFSKNDGEITVFSRVDRSRDLLSYVRAFDDTEFPKKIFVEPKQKSSKSSANASFIKKLPYPILLIYIVLIKFI
uniref:Uncharacterized protein n=1 Tax=Panagrolaimus sp. PS1159 TaxID=55785 RepID=A0AC35FJ22_9BILA